MQWYIMVNNNSTTYIGVILRDFSQASSYKTKAMLWYCHSNTRTVHWPNKGNTRRKTYNINTVSIPYQYNIIQYQYQDKTIARQENCKVTSMMQQWWQTRFLNWKFPSFLSTHWQYNCKSVTRQWQHNGNAARRQRENKTRQSREKDTETFISDLIKYWLEMTSQTLWKGIFFTFFHVS